MSDWTVDRPAPGLVVHQPRAGFRYGAEAFWLVGFALEGGIPATALDLGTGSGIMAWLLGLRGVDVLGVDVRPEWQEGWAASAAASVVPGRVRLQLGSVEDEDLPLVDLVVSNPPFFTAGSGPAPTDPWRRAARFEGAATLATFAHVAVGRLRPGGRACFVVPVEREADLIDAIPAGHHAARRVRVGRRRVLVELRAGEGSPTVEDPGGVEEIDDRGARAAAWYRVVTAPGLPRASGVPSSTGP